MTETHNRRARLILYLPLLLLVILASGLYSLPIWDIDFWWHMASARQSALSNQLITSVDAFGVYTQADPIRVRAVSGSQWLGQKMLWQLFEAGGVNAVIALRAAILVTCLLIVFWRCRLLGAGTVSTWIALLLVMQGLRAYQGDRPQLISFLLAAVLIVLLDLYRRDRHVRWLIAIPPLLFLWANSHGGVLLGGAILFFWGCAELLRGGPDDINRTIKFKRLIILGLFSLAAFLAAPAGIDTLQMMVSLQDSTLQQYTSEYRSSFMLWKDGLLEQQLLVAAFYLFTILALPGLFSQQLPERLMLTLFLAAIAISAMRYLPFFLIVAAPYLAAGMTAGVGHRISSRLQRLWPKSQSELLTHALASAVLIGTLIFQSYHHNLFNGGIAQGRFPQSVTNFIRENQIQGRLFTTVGWGGYFLWHHYPEVTPYVDGRMLNPDKLPPYLNMLHGSAEGLLLFERLQFNLVVLPIQSWVGARRYELVDYLRRSPNWALVHGNPAELLFLRTRR